MTMKIFRLSALVLLLLAASFGIAADQKAPANPPQNAAPAQAPPPRQGTQTQNPEPHILRGEQQPAPIGPLASGQQQLNQASKEAAGEEEDETKVFKESPSVEWAAQHLGLSLRAAYWVLILINFAIIAAFIVWGWKKNVPAMFRARTESIRKNLDEARRASEDANRRLGEIESRLSKLDTEIAEMRKAAEADAIAEEQRIEAAAEEDRRKVIEGAEQEIEAAAKAARRDLKAYAASLAVSLAEKKIQIDRNTDQALVTRFVHDLARNGGKDGR
jgi:F-type H+-transporting ATPase subunit b